MEENHKNLETNVEFVSVKPVGISDNNITLTQSEAPEEDCDITEIEIPPPMEIQEHSYQTIMSNSKEPTKDVGFVILSYYNLFIFNQL